jgi:hypothetical protein
METLLKTGEHKLFYKLVLFTGVAMVVYGSYNWYNNRKSDDSLNVTTPPNNPSNQETISMGTTGGVRGLPTTPIEENSGISHNSIGNSNSDFWSKK